MMWFLSIPLNYFAFRTLDNNNYRKKENTIYNKLILQTSLTKEMVQRGLQSLLIQIGYGRR